MESRQKDPTLSGRNSNSPDQQQAIKDHLVDASENNATIAGFVQANTLRQNSATVSKGSISSMKRSHEPVTIKEEVVEGSQNTDLDTLILKAQQNYALSKQVIDKITNCNDGTNNQQAFANLVEVKSSLTAAISDEQSANTQRRPSGSQAQKITGNAIYVKESEDETIRSNNKGGAFDEYYSLKSQAQQQSVTHGGLAPAVKAANSNQSSPAVADRAHVSNTDRLEGNHMLKEHPSQVSLASNVYVHTEAPISDRQPPEVLREHLIQKLGFQPEPLPSIHSQREQMLEYNEQMEQLKKLQDKFSSQKLLKINQTSGSLMQNDVEGASGNNLSDDDTLHTQDGDDIHTFNRTELMKSQGRGQEKDQAGKEEQRSPRMAADDNARIDTGHFNSKAAPAQEMNAMSSAHMDASQATPSARDSLVLSQQQAPKNPKTCIREKPYAANERQTNTNVQERVKSPTVNQSTSIHHMSHLSPDQSAKEQEPHETYRDDTDAQAEQRYMNSTHQEEGARDEAHSIPSSIHSREQSECMGEPTVFSLQLQKLYDNIQMICPKFGIETGETSTNRIVVSPDLQHHSTVLAIQLYNQVCYLYQQVKDAKLAALKKPESSDKNDLQLTNKMQIENNMLKIQADNYQRETEFYKGQIEMLKEQLKIAAYRDKENSSGYEEKIETLMHDVNGLEERNAELDGYVREQEQRNEQLRAEIAHLQAEQEQNRGQLSFRDMPSESKPQPQQQALPAEYLDFLARKNEDSEKLATLMQETRDLRQKLKMQEEIAGFEKDLNLTLKKQLENLQDTKRKELEMCQNDIQRLQSTIHQKNETIKVVTQQIDDFASLVSIEFPLFAPPNGGRKGQPDAGQLNNINLSNQNKSPKFISMTRNGNNEAVMSLLSQFDTEAAGDAVFPEPLSSFEHGYNDVRNQKGPLLRRKSTGPRLGAKGAKGKRGSSASNVGANYERLFNLPQVVEQQIATTIFCDQVLKDHKASLANKNKRINDQLDYVSTLEEQMVHFKRQKEEFSKNQKKLTKDNEELKVKFSQLLDQFQEYVNESERKTEEEQKEQKEIQDKLLNDLNCTIRELEEMSQNLQRDGEEKDQVIADLQKDRDILQKDMAFLKERYKQTEEHKEQLQNVKIQSLNEEINYLKKHYMVEMDVMKQENKNLRMKIRAQSARRSNLANDASTVQSPFDQRSLKMNDQQSSFERQVNFGGESMHPDFGPSYNGCDDNNQDPTGLMQKNMMDTAEQSMQTQQFNARLAGLQYQRTSSGHREANRPVEFDNNALESGNNSRRDREMQGSEYHLYGGNHSNSAHPGYHNLRSKSHERAHGTSNLQLGDDELERSLPNGGTADQNQGYYHPNHFDQKYDGELARQNFSGAKTNSESFFRNKVGQAREFMDQDGVYARGRPRVGNPGARSQHSVESRERAHMTGDDKLLRANERLLLSAKKENSLLNNMRNELDEKKQQIEFQNQEIAQLRYECGELKAKQSQDAPCGGTVTQLQRSRLLMDIDGAIETLKSELERVKVNLWNEQQKDSEQQMYNMANHVVKEIDEEIHAVKSEDRLMSILGGRVKQLNRLLSLSSEILLLSTKQKYMPAQQVRFTNQGATSALKQDQTASGPILFNHESCKPESFKQVNADDEALIDENNALKRTIYKYENTLAQLDSIFRRDNDKEECIYELKKLTENQLHQILRLQKEIDGHERRAKQMQQQTPTLGQVEQENDVLKQEISMLRERLAHHEQNRDSQNHNLQNEKMCLTQQISALESQLQDKQQQLSEAQAGLTDKDAQLDEIRSRITVVAELFEKKPIKQRYSFEVLCDFIHDKAKRLFVKYDNAIKDKKQFNDEKVTYYHRKISALEVDNEKLKDSSNLLRIHVVPKLANLINKSLKNHSADVERVSGTFVRELLDEVAFQFGDLQTSHARLKNQNLQSADKLKHLQMLLEQRKINEPKIAGVDMPESSGALNTFGNQSVGESGSQGAQQQNMKYLNTRERSVSPLAQTSHPDEQAAELDRMKKEKHEMNQKLEEFAQIMRDFQANQQIQAEENGQLKVKIDQLEHAKRSVNMSSSKEEFTTDL